MHECTCVPAGPVPGLTLQPGSLQKVGLGQARHQAEAECPPWILASAFCHVAGTFRLSKFKL